MGSDRILHLKKINCIIHLFQLRLQYFSKNASFLLDFILYFLVSICNAVFRRRAQILVSQF